MSTGVLLLLSSFLPALCIQGSQYPTYETEHRVEMLNATAELVDADVLQIGSAVMSSGTFNKVLISACSTLVCFSRGDCTAAGMTAFDDIIDTNPTNITGRWFRDAVASLLDARLGTSAAACSCTSYGRAGRFCNETGASATDACGVLNGDGRSCCPEFSQQLSDGSCECLTGLQMVQANHTMGGQVVTEKRCCSVFFDAITCNSTMTDTVPSCECVSACEEAAALAQFTTSLSCRSPHVWDATSESCLPPTCDGGECTNCSQAWTLVQAINGAAAGQQLGRAIALGGNGSSLAVGGNNGGAGDTEGNILHYDGSPAAQRSLMKTLLASDGITGDELARSPTGVQMSRTPDTMYIAAGAPSKGVSGAVYLFGYDGTEFGQIQKVVVSGQAGDDFGETLALNDEGNILAVGAPGTTVSGTVRAGRVHVFGYASRHVSRIQTIDPPASANATGARFGTVLGMSRSSSLLAVGAVDETVSGSPSAGAVHLYAREARSYCTYSYLSSLHASDPSPFSLFGFSIGVGGDGSVVAVGAPASPSVNASAVATGAVHVYLHNSTSFVHTQRLEPSSLHDGAQFGASVAVSSISDVIAVGAPHYSLNGGNEGRVFVFSLTSGEYGLLQILDAPDCGRGGGRFGTVVVASSMLEEIIVGADEDNGGAAASGVVYVYAKGESPWQTPSIVNDTAHTALDMSEAVQVYAYAVNDSVSAFSTSIDALNYTVVSSVAAMRESADSLTSNVTVYSMQYAAALSVASVANLTLDSTSTYLSALNETLTALEQVDCNYTGCELGADEAEAEVYSGMLDFVVTTTEVACTADTTCSTCIDGVVTIQCMNGLDEVLTLADCASAGVVPPLFVRGLTLSTSSSTAMELNNGAVSECCVDDGGMYGCV
eukprot:CAMPEP_0113900182 /NCGR_PEP_ID=MMETSP0780_2-20120614/20515_1 /TAXON_ID=652834 /ORGANISM="Palpitomonas bilix" /LENGTH=886 /DNA_ID=CAMNT_0000892573 /DNA_START=552 /DNA_END=3212 /DNA_ORIENTATION=- /assembly_acc=CAM_ASM_000599